MMDVKRVLLQWFINFLIKKLQAEQSKMKLYLIKNQLKNYSKGKGYSSFVDSIWGAGLADMQLISKFIERVRFLS